MTVGAPDVAIVGGGLIGLATALACADRGLRVLLSHEGRPGAASGAAAGMLAPSTGGATGGVASFATACRDAWPAYLDELAERAGARVALNRLGILQIPRDTAGADRGRPSAETGSEWLDAAQVARLEPGLHAPLGARLLRDDGAVDNEHLMAALADAVATTDRITLAGPARGLRLQSHATTLLLADGRECDAGCIVLAAGAWVVALGGLPRPLPVVPVRGQMIGFSAAPIRHVIEGPDAYLVPRPGRRTIAGATMEWTGFDSGTTAAAAATLASAAGALVPRLSGVAVTEHWAGLRPMTPDQLPILGPDPDQPSLLYACGHSRNGVLMTPLTAACLAALAAGEPSPLSLAAFSVTRFG